MKLNSPIQACLWFDSNAEEAARFYTEIFANSRITDIAYYGEGGEEVHGRTAGTVMTVAFELSGTPFVALNGGPVFTFTEAISFQIMCETQSEIDYYWSRLSEGGDEKAQQCGWLRDKFGLSWQVVPTQLVEMLKDRERYGRVFAAMIGMKKLDLQLLRDAYDR